jgi:hypothetical protein
MRKGQRGRPAPGQTGRGTRCFAAEQGVGPSSVMRRVLDKGFGESPGLDADVIVDLKHLHDLARG